MTPKELVYELGIVIARMKYTEQTANQIGGQMELGSEWREPVLGIGDGLRSNIERANKLIAHFAAYIEDPEGGDLDAVQEF